MPNHASLISLLRTKQANQVGEMLGRAGKKALTGSGDFGAAVARGAGINEGLGRTLGYGAAIGAGVMGAKAVDRKRQELLYRAGYYG